MTQPLLLGMDSLENGLPDVDSTSSVSQYFVYNFCNLQRESNAWILMLYVQASEKGTTVEIEDTDVSMELDTIVGERPHRNSDIDGMNIHPHILYLLTNHRFHFRSIKGEGARGASFPRTDIWETSYS